MFKTKTIDSVLAVARKVVDDLHTLSQEHHDEATKLNEAAEVLAEQASWSKAESTRAYTLAEKWAELV